ncbi:hypothetical protein A500_10035 [Clostridium sartagoforme AAU1]|uniref:Uncharacterized protein n=1 Tax=Clostridium sartagoforme AAU1 TaxID=1202534 RepID=R9C813_9CLOT|nr:hypothetical protein [Clostridium sartagoforme]EOR25398.1 hypothetical protein A500_10035 [Clostridium sartagoforme AAU1]
MEVEKKSLRNMMVINFIIGLIIIVIIKLYKPEYCSLSGVIVALIKSKELIALFYIVLMVVFVIFTYVLALISIHVIGSMTIGKAIRFVKEMFGIDASAGERNIIDPAEEYTYLEVALIAIYAFLILPMILYMLWPALSVILIIILIIVAIGSC